MKFTQQEQKKQEDKRIEVEAMDSVEKEIEQLETVEYQTFAIQCLEIEAAQNNSKNCDLHY